MLITLANGTKKRVKCGDKVELACGHKGVIHCWTGDNSFMVTLDKAIDAFGIDRAYPPVKAFQCEGKHVYAVTEPTNREPWECGIDDVKE